MKLRRNVVVFESDAFNCSDPRDYFINPECFGDDLAIWLKGELAARGIRVDEGGQEDFGWYFSAMCDQADHFVFVGFRPAYEDDPGAWVVVVERRGGGLMRFLFGKRPAVADCLVDAISSALRSAANVREIKWHFQADFDAGREEAGAMEP